MPLSRVRNGHRHSVDHDLVTGWRENRGDRAAKLCALLADRDAQYPGVVVRRDVLPSIPRNTTGLQGIHELVDQDDQRPELGSAAVWVHASARTGWHRHDGTVTSSPGLRHER